MICNNIYILFSVSIIFPNFFRDLIGEKLKDSTLKIGSLFFNLETMASINENLLKV